MRLSPETEEQEKKCPKGTSLSQEKANGGGGGEGGDFQLPPKRTQASQAAAEGREISRRLHTRATPPKQSLVWCGEESSKLRHVFPRPRRVVSGTAVVSTTNSLAGIGPGRRYVLGDVPGGEGPYGRCPVPSPDGLGLKSSLSSSPEAARAVH